MAAFAQLVGPLVIFATLMLLGLVFGTLSERRHYRSLQTRERELNRVQLFPERLPPPTLPAPQTTLVGGSVVISADYFKRFIAILRMLVGGRLNTYESLLDRARREAIVRLREQARDLGAQSVFNLKLETSSIAGRSARAGVACLEVYAYGTALIPARPHTAHELSKPSAPRGH